MFPHQKQGRGCFSIRARRAGIWNVLSGDPCRGKRIQGKGQAPNRSLPCNLLSSPCLPYHSLFKAYSSGKGQGCRWIGWVWEERLFSLSLPSGPDFHRHPLGTGECYMVPECLYFVSGLIKLFGDTMNTPHSPCKITCVCRFLFFK